MSWPIPCRNATTIFECLVNLNLLSQEGSMLSGVSFKDLENKFLFWWAVNIEHISKLTSEKGAYRLL